MFVVTVTFEIHPEHLAAFRETIRTQAKNSITLEPACHQFDVCFDPETPERCFLYEKYTDEAAFAVHRQTDHFATFSEAVGPMVASKSLNTWFQD